MPDRGSYGPWGDRLMYGVEGSTMTGLINKTVVVDDPFGCVVPSDGVEIVGRPSLWHLSRLRSEVFDRMVPDPTPGRSHVVMVKREEAPRIKGAKPKVRKLAKGLRP